MFQKMPAAPSGRPMSRVQTDIAPKAFEQWDPGLRAAADDNNDIGIFDVIGDDIFGDGVSAKRISAALRSIGAENPVTVNINSPGGDLFEGLAIYNLLREHRGEVTVRILSLAASAASVIAMAGDRIEIARSGFLMIHNAWVLAMGNRNDLREVAEFLEPFDRAMVDIYSARTGKPAVDIETMVDKESWIGGTDAIDNGFADGYLPSDQVEQARAEGTRVAAHRVDVALAKAGIPRSERRKLMNELKPSTQNAAGGGTPGAADDDTQNAVELSVWPLSRVSFKSHLENSHDR